MVDPTRPEEWTLKQLFYALEGYSESDALNLVRDMIRRKTKPEEFLVKQVYLAVKDLIERAYTPDMILEYVESIYLGEEDALDYADDVGDFDEYLESVSY